MLQFETKLQRCIRMRITYSKFSFGEVYILEYTIRYHVLPLYSRVPVKLNFRPYIRRYTSPINILIQLSPNWSYHPRTICAKLIFNRPGVLNMFNKSCKISLHYVYRRMTENGFAPPTREFCRHILSCRELKAESFKRCLHSVLRGVSL